MGKEYSFQQMVLGQLDSHMQKKKKQNMKLYPYLTPCIKINNKSTWIKDLKIRVKT